MESSYQHIISSSLEIEPKCDLRHATDGFGNYVQYGSCCSEHSHFRIVAEGVVECLDTYAIPDDHPEDFYLYPTHHTQWNKDIQNASRHQSATDIMQIVHSHMHYQRFVTDTTTTAIEAWNAGCGVCQDYAHVMIAACLSAGLRARYACGLIVGEGETHAWVEVHDGHQWLGYDPTYNRQIENGYIKFAHGRDANDCPINRGRFYQWTSELLNVHSVVTPQ